MSTYSYVKQLGFDSIINYVNNGPNGTLNPDRLNGVLNHMSQNGWREIFLDKDNIASLQPSIQIRYIMKDDDGLKFRTGGFFIRFYDQDDDDSLTDSYLLYSTHKPGINSTMQYNTLHKMYIKEKTKKLKIQKTNVVKYKYPTNETNFPVTLPDEYGEDVVVYYAKDNNARNKFIGTVKYQNALDYGWEFN